MIPYADVLQATRETMTKLAKLTDIKPLQVEVTANGGTTASVDWRARGGRIDVTVNMPSLAPGALVSRAEADRMVGFVVHELGHVLFTDMTVWRRAAKGDDVLFHLINGLEDCRMELDIIRKGFAPNALSLLSRIIEHFAAEGLAKGFSVKDIGSLPFGFAILGRAQNGYTVPSAAAVKIHPALRAVVAQGLRELPACQDTAAVCDLAKRLLGQARKAAADAAQQPQQGKGQGKGQQQAKGQQQGADQGKGDQPQPGQGAGDGAGDSSSSSSQGDQGDKGQQPQQDAGQGQGDSSGQQPGQGAGQGQGDSSGQQPGQGAGQGQGDSSGQQPGQGAGRVKGAPVTRETVTHAGDLSGNVIKDAVKRNGTVPIDDHRVRDLINHQRADVSRPERFRTPSVADDMIIRSTKEYAKVPARLVSEVRKMLKAVETSGTERFLTTGRLDRRAICRMRAGATNVFTRREDTPGVNTGVALLIDDSSSMAGAKISGAQSMALHIGNACQSIGADVMIAGLGHNSLPVFKDWHERKAQLERGASRLAAHGGSPIARSIMNAVDAIAARPFLTRRIVLALSDGECMAGAAGIRIACDYGKARGVEVIGMALQTRSYADLGFRHGIDVPYASQLSDAALTALAKALRQSEARR